MELYFWLGKYADDPSWDELAETGQMGPSTLELSGMKASFHYTEYLDHIPPCRFQVVGDRLVERSPDLS
tara:strand:- start:125 stop:331 length:207 start_codon:yes stop_codon:yes gene_type:complete